MTRNKYLLKNKTEYGHKPITSYSEDVAMDETDMKEIVKRFNMGEEIPSTNEQLLYQYNDEMSQDGKKVISEAVTDEVIALTPNYPDSFGLQIDEENEVAEEVARATDKARRYVRAKEAEAKSKAQKEKADRLAKVLAENPQLMNMESKDIALSQKINT